MGKEFKITHGFPYPLGASVIGEGKVNFAVVMNTDNPCGVVLYDKKTKKETRLYFCCSNKIGNIRCMQIEPVDIEKYDYNFFDGDTIICDPYSRAIKGNEKWGKFPSLLRSSIIKDDYDKKADSHPLLTFNNSIIYLLHVRGFTKHSSSKVNNPGTFEGVVEKIDYLKSLGITTVELMPVYNFVEMEEKKKVEEGTVANPFENPEPKLNYWGYKDSYYFAPKQSYASKGIEPEQSFNNLVKAFHDNGMEVILQFFFPDYIKQGYIFEVLKFWMSRYHVDGFHLMGSKLPLAMLATEPMLANTKMIFYDFPLEDIYEHNFKPSFKNLAVCSDEYMYDMRRFLKSDEGLIGKVTGYMKNQPEKMAGVHYITHSNGFTLMDLVSYDKKHNEDNGENNRDGAQYNGSWNCGEEGPSRKKAVNRLRIKQIKNAIALNMLTQSTPLLLSGDEFGNSQKGNNNPYCHDSSLTWLNWNDIEKNREIFEFTKQMIAFRNDNKILHLRDSFMMTDYKSKGYPDMSFHSEEAWRLDYDPLCRQFGMLYNSNYSDQDEDGQPYIYVAVNMHWTNHEFAIPKLDGKRKWEVVLNTDTTGFVAYKPGDNKVIAKERSIVILIGR